MTTEAKREAIARIIEPRIDRWRKRASEAFPGRANLQSAIDAVFAKADAILALDTPDADTVRVERAEAAQLNLYRQAEHDRELRKRAEEAFRMIAPFVAKFAAAVPHYSGGGPRFPGSTVFYHDPEPGYRPALTTAIGGPTGNGTPPDGPTLNDLRMLAEAYEAASAMLTAAHPKPEPVETQPTEAQSEALHNALVASFDEFEQPEAPRSPAFGFDPEFAAESKVRIAVLRAIESGDRDVTLSVEDMRLFIGSAQPQVSEERARKILAEEYARDGHGPFANEIQYGNINRTGMGVAIRAMIRLATETQKGSGE